MSEEVKEKNGPDDGPKPEAPKPPERKKYVPHFHRPGQRTCEKC